MAPDGAVLVVHQDMSIARAEFLRSLPAAVGSVAFDDLGGEFTHGDAQRSWRIVLTPLPDLAIGLLRLPRHRVQIFLTGFDVIATKRFVDRFELHFRRGGG